MKTIYLNLEDDVAKTVAKIKATKAQEVVLVIPKDSYLLGDSINLRLLKKQVDLLNVKTSVLTMDITGKMYAREAGFALKRLPKVAASKSFSDIRPSGSTKIYKPHEVLDNDDLELDPAATKKPTKKTGRRAVVGAAAVGAAAGVGAAASVGSAAASGISGAPKVGSSKVYKTKQQVAADNLPADWLSENHENTKPLSDNVFMPPSSNAKQLPRKRSYLKWVMGFVIVSLIAVLVLAFVVLPTGSVTVYPQAQAISRDVEVTVNSNVATADSSKLVVPATSVSESKQVSQSFNVNGKKEVGAKAQGRVAIYNLTGSPLNLRAATTVLTVGTRSYYFTQDQNNIVPLESASSDQNASTADILAGEGGEDYNLPAGTRMEINNQAFGSQPQRLYAKTVTQVIGGSSRYVSVISSEDITAAQTALIKTAVDQVNSGLPNDRKLVEGAYTVELQNFTTDKPEGTEATTFNASGTVLVKGLAFNEAELQNMLRARLEESIGEDKTLQPADLDVAVYKINNLDFEAGVMQLAVHYESKAMPVINEEAMAKELAGKSQAEAEDLLLSDPDIEKVDISLSPSWQTSFPRIASKIHVQVVE
jgi:hypothetical protein